MKILIWLSLLLSIVVAGCTSPQPIHFEPQPRDIEPTPSFIEEDQEPQLQTEIPASADQEVVTQPDSPL